MDLKINYNNCTDKDQAYQAVKSNITDETIAKFKVKAELKYDDAERSVCATGKGFELNITFLDDCAQLKLNLSLLYRAFKSKILDTLERKISKVI